MLFVMGTKLLKCKKGSDAKVKSSTTWCNSTG